MAILSPEYAVAALVERGVPPHVAQGVVMNFQDESGLDTGIQEQAPLAGRGGFGLAQWTGPRRIALEDFARSQGKSVDDPDVQLDFFMHENAGVEAPAWKTVMAAPTAQDAAVAFVNNWERPASRHAAERTARYSGGSEDPRLDTPSSGRPVGSELPGPASPYSLKPATAVAAASPTKKAGKWDKLGGAFQTGLKGMGEMKAPVMGAGGNAPQLPTQAPLPMDSMPIVSGAAGGSGRDDLALLIQRLNTQRLWG